MGFGHRVYRAEDPRARVLRETCRRLDAPRFEVAAALEEAALAELHERRPDRVLATNVEFWAAVVKPGTVLYELGGISEDAARAAFARVAYKMPVRCRFVTRRPTL